MKLMVFGPCCRREEEWVRLPDVPDYLISNLGRLRRRTRGQGTRPGKIIKPARSNRGHLQVHMPTGNGDRLRGRTTPRPKHLLLPMARLVMAAFGEDSPSGDWGDLTWRIHHTDNHADHNCDTNLQWLTQSAHLKGHHKTRRRERASENDDDNGRTTNRHRLRPLP